jgi:type IV pilus assembly protein PilC
MGQPFSEALGRQGEAFPSLLVNMVKASEMTGEIEETLDDMANYYQEVEDLKKAIVSALAYPCVVMVVACIILVFMLTYIVPQFVSVFESMKAEIPAITQFTLNLSAFLQEKWYVLVIGLVAIVITYIVLFTKVKAFRSFMQSIFMKLPVVGKLIISKEISMFARTNIENIKNILL